MKLTQQERQAKWDRGEYVYSEPEDNLMKLIPGTKIGNIFSNCTVCPAGNAACNEYFAVTITGFHPEKRRRIFEIWICSLGVMNSDDCPLNK